MGNYGNSWNDRKGKGQIQNNRMTEQSLYEVEMDANQGGLTYKDIIMGQYKRITFFL